MTDLKKLYQSDLPNRAIAVYLYLRGRANKEGFCWPAVPTMARELKVSESTIRRALRDLVREGFLVVEKRQRDSGADSSNRYILTRQFPVTVGYSDRDNPKFCVKVICGANRAKFRMGGRQ